MKTYSISQLARKFDLSRSTLLYYDRIGLLQAFERTGAGYRRYSTNDRKKLERICLFRRAGLPLSDIQKLLAANSEPSVKVLEKRLRDLGDEILQLRGQQHMIIAMLKNMTNHAFAPAIDKRIWVEMMAAAGMDEKAMNRGTTDPGVGAGMMRPEHAYRFCICECKNCNHDALTTTL